MKIVSHYSRHCTVTPSFFFPGHHTVSDGKMPKGSQHPPSHLPHSERCPELMEPPCPGSTMSPQMARTNGRDRRRLARLALVGVVKGQLCRLLYGPRATQLATCFCEQLLAHSHTHSFERLSVMVFATTVVEDLQHRPCGPQNLKCLPTGPLRRKSAQPYPRAALSSMVAIRHG